MIVYKPPPNKNTAKAIAIAERIKVEGFAFEILL